MNPWLVETDTANFFDIDGGNGMNARNGPWEYGGYRYFLTQRQSVVSGAWAAMWRTNDGKTFQLMDFAHAPTVNGFLSYRFGNVVYIGIVDTNNQLALGSFDLTTNLYGTTITNPDPANFASRFFAPWAFVIRSDGSAVFINEYFLFGGPPVNDRATVYSGGVWTTTTLTLKEAWVTLGFVLLPNDTLLWCYETLKISVPSSGSVYTNGLTLGGSVLGDTLVSTMSFSNNVLNNGRQLGGLGVYVASNDTAYFSGLNSDSVSFTSATWTKNLCVVTVTSASTTPTASVVPVSDAPGSQALHKWDSVAMWQDNALMYVGLVRIFDDNSNEQIPTWEQTLAGGGWSSTTVFYDYNVAPPLPAGNGQVPSTEVPLAPIFILNGAGFGTMLGIDDKFTAGDIYYMEPPSGVIPSAPEKITRRTGRFIGTM